VAFLPRPLIYAHLAHRAFAGEGKLQDASDDGLGGREHAKGRGNLRGIGSIGEHSGRLECLDQPISHPGVTLDHLWEAFSKDVLGTQSLWTDPLAHQQFERETSPTKREINNGALIAAVDS